MPIGGLITDLAKTCYFALTKKKENPTQGPLCSQSPSTVLSSAITETKEAHAQTDGQTHAPQKQARESIYRLRVQH